MEGDDRRLSHTSAAVLAAMGLDERRARHDLYEAQIELSSPPCRRPRARRSRAPGAARRRSRPAGAHGDRSGHPPGRRPSATCSIVDAERYARDGQRLRGTGARAPPTAPCTYTSECPTPRRRSASATACASACRCSRHCPRTLPSGTASTPGSRARRQGAAARVSACRHTPRLPRLRRLPGGRVRRDAGGSRSSTTTRSSGGRSGPIRRFGTVEVRAMDSQSSLGDASPGWRRSSRGSPRTLAETPAAPVPRRRSWPRRPSARGATVSTATLHDGRRSAPGARVAADALELARPHARELGSDAPLEEIERILRDGNGADRQRAAHRRGGMTAVLDDSLRDAAVAPRGRALPLGIVAGMKIESLDHVALWVADRDLLADFLTAHTGMHVIERTDAFTIVGADARRGKLTLFAVTGRARPGPLARDRAARARPRRRARPAARGAGGRAPAAATRHASRRHSNSSSA